MHDGTLDAVEYLPAPHSVHVVAPVPAPVFVTEPAAQSAHDTTFEAIEYLPAAHAVHALAPTLMPVSVIDPAWHDKQIELPLSCWYCPVAHASHLGALITDEDWPAGHALQLFVELSAYVPGKQFEQ